VERVAAAPDGRVWFSQGEASLCRLDPGTNTVLYYSLPTGSAALAVAVEAKGQVWFSDTGQAALGRLDPDTGDIVLWPIPGGQQPFALTFTPAGEIWFTDREADLLGLFRPETGEFLLYPVPLGSHPFFLAVGQDGAVWFTAERGNYVARLARSQLSAPQGPFAPESFVVTGYAVSQSGNKAELTIAYTYDGTAGVPIWLTLEVLREGQVLPGFSASAAAIEAAGSGKVNLLLTYQGIGPQTSDTLRILVLLAPEGPGSVVKEIAFRATWIP
jgi:streptogramin lyase